MATPRGSRDAGLFAFCVASGRFVSFEEFWDIPPLVGLSSLCIWFCCVLRCSYCSLLCFSDICCALDTPPFTNAIAVFLFACELRTGFPAGLRDLICGQAQHGLWFSSLHIVVWTLLFMYMKAFLYSTIIWRRLVEAAGNGWQRNDKARCT